MKITYGNHNNQSWVHLIIYFNNFTIAISENVLFIPVAPYDVEIIGMRRYPYGSDIELNCTSEGGPQLEYTWIFSNSTIDNDTMLNINSATVTDGGDYTCNVTNNAGFSSNTTTVYSELIKLLLRDIIMCTYLYQLFTLKLRQ